MFNITHEWQQVMKYYNSIESEFDKQLYLSGLNKDQKNYLLGLIGEEKTDKVNNELEIYKHDIFKETPYNYFHNNKKHLEPEYKSERGLVIREENRLKLEQIKKKGLSKKKPNFLIKTIKKGGSLVRKHSRKFAMATVVSVVGALSFSMLSDFIKDQAENTRLAYANTAHKNNYNSWVESLIDSDTSKESDYDKDGLSNYEEFQLKTNPGESDMNGNTLLDGEDVLHGVNPATNKIFENNLELSRDLIVYRLQKLALENFEEGVESISGSNYLNETPKTEEVGYLTIENLEIDKMPINWKVSDLSEDEFLNVLADQSIYYDQTKLPGETGNTYIFASSERGQTVFENLSDLSPKDAIYIEANTNQDRKVVWKYVVTVNNLYSPDNIDQFKQNKLTELSLATLNDDGYVLVVKARLVSVNEVVQEEGEDSNLIKSSEDSEGQEAQ